MHVIQESLETYIKADSVSVFYVVIKVSHTQLLVRVSFFLLI